jgi:hypothetical protein
MMRNGEIVGKVVESGAEVVEAVTDDKSELSAGTASGNLMWTSCLPLSRSK